MVELSSKNSKKPYILLRNLIFIIFIQSVAFGDNNKLYNKSKYNFIKILKYYINKRFKKYFYKLFILKIILKDKSINYYNHLFIFLTTLTIVSLDRHPI